MSGAVLAAVLCNLIGGLLGVGLSIPLVLGRVPRNGWYGVRTAASLRSDEAWFELNRCGGRWLLAGCTLTALSGLAGWLLAGLSVAAFLPLLVVVPELRRRSAG